MQLLSGFHLFTRRSGLSPSCTPVILFCRWSTLAAYEKPRFEPACVCSRWCRRLPLIEGAKLIRAHLQDTGGLAQFYEGVRQPSALPHWPDARNRHTADAERASRDGWPFCFGLRKLCARTSARLRGATCRSFRRLGLQRRRRRRSAPCGFRESRAPAC